MKLHCTRLLAFFVVGSAILATASCSKSGGGSSGNSVSATVNGTAWANSFSVIALYSSNGGFDIIGQQFKGGDSTSIDLAFASPIIVNHPVSSDTSAFVLAYTDTKNGNQTGYAVLTGGFGNAVYTITSYDSTGHRIAGSFSGVLYNISNYADSLTVTNGKFNTSFTAQ